MTAIVWTRHSPTMIEWSLEDENGPQIYHANRSATFIGPATGENIYRRQVHGWASSPQRDTVGATSAALRREFKAASVRFAQ